MTVAPGDISLICFNLELRPGATVLESGTGSGSLTTALCRAVGPTGRVRTFEFHEERARIAAEEFESNGERLCQGNAIICPVADDLGPCTYLF